jgi:hypothetical protein
MFVSLYNIRWGESFEEEKKRPKGSTPLQCYSYYLKPLSSEMDPADIRLIYKVFIKERGAEVLQKNPAVPNFLESPLKSQRRLVQ